MLGVDYCQMASLFIFVQKQGIYDPDRGIREGYNYYLQYLRSRVTHAKED